MKFINFSIDDYIANILTQNEFFKDIHPNAITLVGIICNIIIILYNNNNLARLEFERPRRPSHCRARARPSVFG